MKQILIIFVLLFMVIQPVGATAASAPDQTAAPETDPSSQTPPVDQAAVKRLIETLESETARTELLGNLKLLLNEQAKQDEQAQALALPLTEQIGVRGFLAQLGHDYQNFLDRNNLSGSLVNQILGSVIVLGVWLILLYGVKRTVRKLGIFADRLIKRLDLGPNRLHMYINLLKTAARVMIAALMIYTLANIWEAEMVSQIFATATARGLVSTTINFMLLLFLAALLWEAINIYLAHILRKADSNNRTRQKTLLPILRNLFFAVFGVMFGLVLLSELGVNVTPLIAGAGVFGVAIGFGAQTMIKDFITGFTIILEDLVRVGDVVTLAGSTGVVEVITLRKIQLRDVTGTVFTIPYSEITTIQNQTKDFSFYVMDIGISYAENPDRVIDVLKGVDADLRNDEIYNAEILEPLEIMGVDRFADNAVIIKARIKTVPLKQWHVGREFNRRMKAAFDTHAIEIPFPQRVVTVRNESAALNDAVLAKVAD